MGDTWVEVPELKRRLQTFFIEQKREFNRFGSTVNQTFEAFVFAQVLGWYKERGWSIRIVNPFDRDTKRYVFRLKVSTRGRPGGYSYAVCTSPDGAETVQVRHQLRVATRHYRTDDFPRANVCLDVAVIRDTFLDNYYTEDHVANAELVTFGEAKHMSAFAELVAGFIGMVHELQPERLKRTFKRVVASRAHPPPFLFVSGKFWATAEGVFKTIARRKLDLNIFNRTKALSESIKLPTVEAPKRPGRSKERGTRRK